MNGILITKPIGSLDRIVHVVLPVIFLHIAQRRINATLSGDRMRAGWEELGDASGLETSFGKAESSAESGSTGANNNGIVVMVDCLVCVGDCLIYKL